MLEPADVVIITAAEGEDTSLHQVTDGAKTSWSSVAAPARYPYEVFAAEFESLRSPGATLRVITSRPGRMGGDHTAQAAGQLLAAYNPRCIAMCGVCAGRPEWTALGDVIIGERVWRYDAGERFNATPGAKPLLRKDTQLYKLPPAWLRGVENAARQWKKWPGDPAWLKTRPRPLDHQALWLLRQLADGRDPAADPQADAMCHDWGDAHDLLVTNKWTNEDYELVDVGRRHIKRVLTRNKRRLPAQRPWSIHAGPMATGNLLVRDVDIWEQLVDSQRLVRGFDMEVSLIGQAAWTAGVPFLVVKGVMDFGLPDRHRGFRPFAARAAAEVLVRLLRTLVEPVNRAVSPQTHAAIAPPTSTSTSKRRRGLRRGRKRGDAGPSASVTQGIVDYVQESGGVGSQQIALRGTPGSSKDAPVTLRVTIDGTAYTLIVADSHSAWRGHQNAETERDFVALFEVLSARAGEDVTLDAVETLAGGSDTTPASPVPDGSGSRTLDPALRRNMYNAITRQTASQFGELLLMIGMDDSPHIPPAPENLATRTQALLRLVVQQPSLARLICDHLGIDDGR